MSLSPFTTNVIFPVFYLNTSPEQQAEAHVMGADHDKVNMSLVENEPCTFDSYVMHASCGQTISTVA